LGSGGELMAHPFLRGISRFLSGVIPARFRLKILPGSQYARVAIPLEYAPAMNYCQRWGYSRPPIAALYELFGAHTDEYRAFLQVMRAYAPTLRDIPRLLDPEKLHVPAWEGFAYDPFDIVALYAMIRKVKPKQYLEIGSGVTTAITRRAITDEGLATRITSIDPSPRTEIDKICDHVIRQGLESCDPAIVDTLEAGDILFFDGSHRSFMNSDVTVFFIDILPRLKPGVIVHVHDITLPWDYDLYFKNWYWNEAYMLAVYLMGRTSNIVPMLPTAFICRDPRFEAEFEKPILDLGDYKPSWRGGGAIWFTHI
jgi:hypothetical protein